MDKIKLSFGDRKNYKWFWDRNTSVCVIPCSINLPTVYYAAYEELISRLFPKVNFRASIWDDKIEFISVGKARCSEEDLYNETIGNRIAEARAKEKAYSVASRIMQVIITNINNDNEIMDNFFRDMEFQQLHEDNHIKFLTGEQ